MKKNTKLLSLILALIILFSTFGIAFGEGTNPIEQSDNIVTITSADQLIELANISWGDQEDSWSKTYKLANDIDMKDATSNKEMEPIGNSNRPFTGVFDGNNYTIKNLEFQVSSENGGLFHSISKGSVIKNLKLENVNLKFYGSSGAIVGKNIGIIENCAVIDSTITATSSTVGGLVGINEGKIEKCYVQDSIVKYDNESTTTTHGGLVGRNKGSIDESYFSGTINAKKWAGGLVGWNYGSIKNCYSTGTINGTEEIGGLVGRSDSGSSITNTYGNCDVTPTESGSGFIGGLNWGGGTVSNCFYNSEKNIPEKSSTSIEGVIAKTSEELKSEETLNALNDDEVKWGLLSNINEGFPYIIAIAPKPSEEEVPKDTTVKVMVATYDSDNYSFKKHIDVTEINIDKEKPTVLEVLEAGKEIIPFTSETREYGKFIKSIDGIEASSPNGWMFTINDKTPSVGVSTATVEDGDNILWYYGTPLNNYKGPKWDELVFTEPEEGKDSEIFEGKGTSVEPYLIKTVDNLKHIIDYPNAHFKVNNTIDLKGISFEPIGTEEKPFTGTFDGNNQEISNLTINKDKESKNIGFFGVINNAKVKNVNIKNADITGGSRLGVLVGYAKEDKNGACLIGNCHVNGKIVGLGTDVIKATRMGGLVGINDGNNDDSYVYSVIDNCSADVNVIGNTTPAEESGHVGGLVGWNRGIITNGVASGNVKGGNTTGGLVGSNWGQIYKSNATGNVTGLYTTGGFAGSNSLYSKIEDSYSTGNVIGNRANGNNYFGGFVGSTSGTIKNCVSIGTVLPGWSWNGGFAGYFDGNNIEKDLENCYGNSTDCLGNKIKGLGNVIDSTNPDYDKYMAVGIAYEDSVKKLEDMFIVTVPENSDNEDKITVKNEAKKYLDNVSIPNEVPEGTNVTGHIVKLKDKIEADPEVLIMYSQREYTGYITDSVPTGQYTLLKRNTDKENVKTSVTLIFVKNGEFVTKDINVSVEGLENINPVKPCALEITRIGDGPVRKGTEGKIKVNIKNKSNKEETAAFVIALFDKTGTKMINHSHIVQSIKAGEDIDMEVGFLIPVSGDYVIKGLVWDNF